MPKRTPFDGAKRLGREARQRGEPKTASPYNSRLTWTSPDGGLGRPTWSQAFHSYWEWGWNEADRELKAETKADV